MRPLRTHRLIAATCITILIAVPSIWLGRQLHYQSLNRALISAIKRSDANKVESLLATGADPNTRDTPEKHETLLQKLKNIMHPPKPDLSPTALILAVYEFRTHRILPRQSLAIVNALLAHGADANAQDDRGNSPISVLFIGFRENTGEFHPCDDPRVLDALLNAHANVNKIGPSDVTPLILACYVRDAGSVRTLLDHGANPNARSGKSDTPLSIAAGWGDIEMVKLLRAHGAKE